MQNQGYDQIFAGGSQGKQNLVNTNFPSLGGGVQAQANVGGQQTNANFQMQGQFNQQQQHMSGMGYQDFNQQPFYQQPNQFQQPVGNQQWGMQQNQMYNTMPMVDQFGQQVFDQFGNVMYQQPGAFAQQQFVGLGQTQSMTNAIGSMSLGNDMPPIGMTSSAPITNLAGANTAASSLGSTQSAGTTSTTTLNTGSSSFVPKKKIVKTEEAFPTLGMSEAPKKKAATQKKEDDQPKKSADPCQGKAKEFFTLVPVNPMFPADPFANPLTPSDEQLKFMFINYPEYAPNPVDLFIWLYSYAQYNEEQIKYQKQMQETDGAYKSKPKIGARGVKGKGKKNQDEEDEEEDTFYFDKNRLKKPAAPPAQPKVVQEDPEKKRLREQKNAEALAKKRQKEATKGIKKVTTQVVDEEVIDVDETRQPASLVFIGHVDAGKSTISGNLMYLMGAVDQRTIQKYKEEAKEKNRESWWLAYVMDVSEEEKAKGKTVEVGRANIETPKKRWTIFDAPGHKNYVPNMIMGAALADFGALVISAKKGEFESGFEMEGQTREHIQLAKSLGISKIVVAVNKMDEPSVKWSKDRYTEIINGLKPFMQGCGYDPEKDIVFVPISGLNGDNLKDPINKAVCNWYQGPTLLEILDDLEMPARDPEGPLRIPVLDKMKDRGTVMFGKVESGTVKLGDQLAVMPTNLLAQVQTIYNSKGESVRYAKPGENVQLRLGNINDENMINKGDVLCRMNEQTAVSDLFEVELDVLELLKYKPILSKGYQFILHIHTVAEEASIKDLISSVEKNDKGDAVEKLKPQFVQSYAKVICRIQTRVPIPLEKFDFLPQMGRFTIRDEGKTIAVGKVLRYKPVKIQSYITPQNTQATGTATAGGQITDAAQANLNLDASAKTGKQTEELIFDMESGEMVTKEEFQRRNKEREEMEGVEEEDEDEEEDN
eukprot:403375909